MKQQIGLTYFYDNFISEEEQEIIREWALRNEKFLLTNPVSPGGPFRCREVFENIPETLDILTDIKSRIVEVENLKGIAQGDFYQDFLSIHKNGSFIQKHFDRCFEGNTYYIRRYNIFIALPEKGGLPIYSDEILKITERSMLKVDAGLIIHGTTPVVGEKPRIILSYGFKLIKNIFDNKL